MTLLHTALQAVFVLVALCAAAVHLLFLLLAKGFGWLAELTGALCVACMWNSGF